MSSKKILEFPDVSNKLQAPTRKSLFERQRADAEAKRLKEEAETKAVYEDFVKSFDDDDDNGGFPVGSGGTGGMGGGRHFGRGGMGMGNNRGGYMSRGGMGMSSGPGSLGSLPGNIGGMTGPRKRTFDGFAQGASRKDDRGLLAFDDYDNDGPALKALKTSDDEDEKTSSRREEERAVAKPTLRLASLPPGTSPAVIKALLPNNLTVDAIRIIPPSGPTSNMERKSMSAIVTLAKDTPANDIDTTVNTLQNKYLGFGYYLNLHRHLSSAAISSTTQVSSLGGTATSQPFGAKPVNPPAGRGHAPPPHRGGFAPPSSYSSTPQLSRSTLFVPVQPPQDIKELKLIHKTIESLLTHGPEFEALLMSRPSVQREEKWAWLWDSRSTGGVWYRWRLWEVLTGSQSRRGQGKYLPLFEGSSAWKQPDQPLAYEYTTRLEEFVSESEYNSSDEDDSGDEGARRPPIDPSTLNDEGKAYLNPLEKAKLTHLLSRLPTSTGKLRKGDVARVTAFAISHAGRGADEVVSALVANVEKPFAYTSANPDRKKEKDTSGDDNEDGTEEEDTSSASLIGLYLISDILSSSSTSGVRQAWRYRQLFEQEMRKRKTFQGLGRMERKMKWGRLRAEKWKRSVGNVLGLWEGWCVFPQESQDEFTRVFKEPPMLPEEVKEAEKKAKEVQNKEKSKWKAVEVAPAVAPILDMKAGEDDEDVDGEPMAEDDEDVDGVPMEEDDDVDGEPMAEDVGEADGEPMQDDGEPYEPPPPDTATDPKEGENIPMEGKPQRRARPRAVDMFADSDDE
ncbi:coatamer subunit protein [Rutstroemia sp. NJR-2017a BVV2]|nr:coatamer subunit protein [Rutstroemia sp. NJR-2017a BVV2]